MPEFGGWKGVVPDGPLPVNTERSVLDSSSAFKKSSIRRTLTSPW